MTANARTVFVTGAASGIGRAVVIEAVARGWNAVAADRDAAALNTLEAALPGRLCRIEADVSVDADVVRAFDEAERALGPIAGVVNSAGIGRDVPALETDTDLFRAILAVNLVGSFSVAREAATRMRSRGGGAIVNIASVSGIRGNAGRTAYGASKAALIGMTQVLAVEWAASGIRVNAVAPGPIDTPLAGRVHTAEVRRQWVSAVPQHRYGTPEDVAAAVLFLLDDSQSGYVTGQTLCVDGGFTAAGIMPPTPP